MKTAASLAAALVVFCSHQALSQGVRIGFEGGTLVVEGPSIYSGNINDGGLGFNPLYSLGLKATLPGFDEWNAFSVRAAVLFTNRNGQLQGEGHISNVTSSLTMVSFSFGNEATLVRGPVAPYIGANLLLNAFGNMKWHESEHNQCSSTSLGVNAGLGFCAGVRFTLSPLTDLGVGLSYNLNNVIGAGFAGDQGRAPTLNTYGISVSVLTSIF